MAGRAGGALAGGALPAALRRPRRLRAAVAVVPYPIRTLPLASPPPALLGCRGRGLPGDDDAGLTEARGRARPP